MAEQNREYLIERFQDGDIPTGQDFADMIEQQIEAARNTLRSEVDRTSAAMQVFPRNAMGVTPDGVKASPEFKNAKAAFDRAFARLRNFNSVYKPGRKRA